MFFRPSAIILLLLWHATGSCADAQSPAATANELLTNAVQIRSLNAKEAARHLPVHLRGVVIGEAEPGGTGFAMLDETAGVYLTSSTNQVAQLHPGDYIEVTGTTDPGWFAPAVIVKTLHKLGVKPLPEPRKVTYQELLTGRYEAQWVELGGVVRLWESSPKEPGKIRIKLATDGGQLMLRWNVPNPPAPIIEAKIRVRGVCYYLANQNRQIRSPMIAIPHDVPIQIETPPPADPYAAPVRPLESLMRAAQEGDWFQRVHVQGVVTRHQRGEYVFMQEGGLGLRVQTSQWGELKPGDEIEALGFLRQGSYSLMLEGSTFRKRSSGPPPVPFRLEKPEDVGGLDANLVELEGIFDKHSQAWAEYFYFHTDTGIPFQAMLRNDDKKKLALNLPVGGRFQVIGVCSVERSYNEPTSGLSLPGSFQILLRSLDDLVLVNPPPWWTRPRIIRALIAAVGISVCASVAVLLLARRRVQEQEARRLAAEREFALFFSERNRMAREIHDTLAQGLGGISIHLEFIRSRLQAAPPEIARHLEITRDLVRKSLADARNAIWDMRSQALQDGDPVTALEATLKQLTEGSAVTGRLTVTGRSRRISPVMENDLLHIGQEALSNAIKHAQAKNIELGIDFGAEEIRLSVKDDGCGFAPDQPPRPDSFGIIGMRERVQQRRGQLLVQSSRTAGTQILATIPTSGA